MEGGDWIMCVYWLLLCFVKPTLSELQEAQKAIRFPNNDFRIPYNIGYIIALKAAEENLERLKYLEDQAWFAGIVIEEAEMNIQSLLASWDM